MINNNKIIYYLQELEKGCNDLVLYVGKLRLLRAIFSSYASGNAKTWEDSLDEVLNTLSSREKEILRYRFGLGGVPKTLEEVGKIFGVTRDRIRQIEQKGIRKLKHPTRRKVLLGLSWQMAVQELKAEGIKLLEEKGEEQKKVNMGRDKTTKTVEELNLPTQIVNSLLKAGYKYDSQVKEATDKELLKIRGIGEKCVRLLRNEGLK